MSGQREIERNKNRNVSEIGGSNIGGNVTISGGSKFVGGNDYSNGSSKIIISQTFQSIYKQIDENQILNENDKKEVKELVKEVETELTNEELPNEKYLKRLFKEISKMAPDIFEVAWKTASNPIGGLSLAVQKIVDKAATDVKAQTSPSG